MPWAPFPTKVSIHIRLCWRMNFIVWMPPDGASASFNPHSPLLANEFGAPGVSFGGSSSLSIHIRHCWRMNCLFRVSRRFALNLFNPHSPLLANEFSYSSCCPAVPPGFNPHSPLLANELTLGKRQSAAHPVSIHIRHCWRMNCTCFALSPARSLFQSTFAIAGE